MLIYRLVVQVTELCNAIQKAPEDPVPEMIQHNAALFFDMFRDLSVGGLPSSSAANVVTDASAADNTVTTFAKAPITKILDIIASLAFPLPNGSSQLLLICKFFN